VWNSRKSSRISSNKEEKNNLQKEEARALFSAGTERKERKRQTNKTTTQNALSRQRFDCRSLLFIERMSSQSARKGKNMCENVFFV
jgi:hypothetical protein